LQPGKGTYTNRLFFLGGADSMRGWLQDTFVPQDVVGQPLPDCDPSVPGGAGGTVNPSTALLAQLGGDAFVLWRNEVRIPIGTTNFALGLFLDAGNLWKGLCHVNPLQLRADAGVGVRYITPIGPVAVDLGFNLAPQPLVPGEPPVTEAPFAFNFSIGTF
jgi:outer membrane protein assembly factor BamA